MHDEGCSVITWRCEQSRSHGVDLCNLYADAEKMFPVWPGTHVIGREVGMSASRQNFGLRLPGLSATVSVADWERELESERFDGNAASSNEPGSGSLS